MSAELIGVLSVGVALGVLIVALWRSVNVRIDRLEDRSQGMEAQMNERFGRMEAQMNERFGQIDERFGRMDERFGQVDERFGRMEDQVNARFERLEDRFETLDARQYEMAQALARIEARQIDAAAPPGPEEQPAMAGQGTGASQRDQGR